MPDAEDARRADRRARARHRAGHAEQSDRRGLSAGDDRAPSRTLCAERGIALVLDETYRDFIAGDAPPHALLRRRRIGPRRSIQLYSFSKAYCIPGHRVGAMVADASVLGEIAKILDTLQICAPRAPQLALPWAIPALRDWRDGNRAEIVARADAFRAAIGAARRLVDRLDRRLFRLSSRIPSRPRPAPRSASGWRASAACSACPAPISAPARRGFCASHSPMSMSRRSQRFPRGSRSTIASAGRHARSRRPAQR